ncbi:unnamed protein product [Leptidea sinapis]|uniref:Insulin-like domain-containing protein n=1 Tax=Leptidea sinapis TaxID=189913 RepID=A0A5E4PZP0_9NEOP|nr:unnamed protein product [Leptidea sinapis]
MRSFCLILLISLGSISLVTNTSGQQYYCGRRLASALAMLCYDGSIEKRAGVAMDNMIYHNQLPWLDRSNARSMNKSKRQIVSECCEKPCTVEELVTYC